MTMCNFLAPCTSFRRHFTCFPESYNDLVIGFVDLHSEKHIKGKCHFICVCWILCHSNDVIAEGRPLGTKTMFSHFFSCGNVTGISATPQETNMSPKINSWKMHFNSPFFCRHVSLSGVYIIARVIREELL